MKLFNKIVLTSLLSGSIITSLVSCSENGAPKPRGFFRIDLPQKSYRMLDSIYPYKFEYPAYAKITNDPNAPDQPYWINLDFRQFKARLHLSYKVVNNDLPVFVEDAHSMVMKHIPKASAIDELRFDSEKNNVHGIVYDIKGIGAASVYQFYVTDSTRNFLRGALYFNALPNNDSLAPVIDFLKKDIMHLIETTEWKQVKK